MIKFICETPDIHKPHTAVEKIEMEVRDEASLDEMMEAYYSFLRAVGYLIPDEWD